MRNCISAFTLFFLLHAAVSSLYAQKTADPPPPVTEKDFERQYQERITKDHLHGIYIPKNLDDALAQLDKLSSEESKRSFKSIPEDSVCLVMHNRLGQWMIVNWSFYEGSRLSNYLRSAGVSYPDDMADFLILAFHHHLNGKPVSIKELAVYFHDMRKRVFEQERREGRVLKEEVRKRPRPEAAEAAPTPQTPDTKPAATPPPTTPKGGNGKQ